MLDDDKYLNAFLKLNKLNNKFIREYNQKMIDFANQSFIFVEYQEAEKALRDIQDRLYLINAIMIKIAHYYQIDELNLNEIKENISKEFKSVYLDEILEYII
jgi:hypothetical protein|nr:MAG TPA: hypothetical protein [Caudoviricetes sp.]